MRLILVTMYNSQPMDGVCVFYSLMVQIYKLHINGLTMSTLLDKSLWHYSLYFLDTIGHLNTFHTQITNQKHDSTT